MKTITIPTLLRLAEHEALSKVRLTGDVVDLGGDARSGYRTYLTGEYRTTVVNLDHKARPDVVHDLEEPLPFPDGAFDHALLINVLEHVYGYRQLLGETARILKPGGSACIVVPFLFPVHPSPQDYWRFTKEALMRECAAAGFTVDRLTPLGKGLFAARYVMLDRLLPGPLRAITHYSLRYVSGLLDACFTALAHRLGKRYDPADYALGYFVHATRR
ncbi:MAG TPA: methyltransferase domain-containing protein [Candidatus Paceibacterota bacterium]|jgi:SAM-dependent methyltransferase